ncbi:Uncharacterized protein FWK35_00030921, partial [Aphis craccivora]
PCYYRYLGRHQCNSVFVSKSITHRIKKKMGGEYYRYNPEITFRLVEDYYPFMVKDHVLNILTDPLRNYILVELCIQYIGTQKWCSSACYHDERSGGFRTYNPITICDRFLTKGVYLESNPFPASIDVVPVPVTYSAFFKMDLLNHILSEIYRLDKEIDDNDEKEIQSKNKEKPKI